MKLINRLNLQTKLTGGFIVLALIASFAAFFTPRFAFDKITDDAIPTVKLVGEIGVLGRAMQAEVLEFMATGEQETLEEFQETKAVLATLTARLETDFSDDLEEVESFENLIEQVQQIAIFGDQILESHLRTIEEMETLEDFEKEAETVFETAIEIVDAELETHIQANDLTLLGENAIPQRQQLSRVVMLNRIVQAEALEFVASGEEDAVGDLEQALTDLNQLQLSFRPELASNSPDTIALFERLDDVEVNIKNSANALVVSHNTTLVLLEALEDQEIEFSKALNTGLLEADEDVARGITEANQNTIVMTSFVLVLALLFSFWLSRITISPLQEMVELVRTYGTGNLDIQLQVDRQDELGILGKNINQMAQDLKAANRQNEVQYQARVSDLENINIVSQTFSSELSIERLLPLVVNELKNRFDFYHVHIYLLDSAKEYLYVAEGSGEVGAKMKAERHQIPLEARKSLVAKAARSGNVINTPNVQADNNWLANPLLPATRSEMAVPITIESEVLGVLDVQSNQIDHFDDVSERWLLPLANQTAFAIRNANLLEESTATLANLREIQAQYIRTGWDTTSKGAGGYQHVHHAPNVNIGEIERQALTKIRQEVPNMDNYKVVPVTDTDRTAYVAPVQIRGENVGDLQLHSPDRDLWRDETNLAIVEAVMEQVAQTAERLRLLDETRQQASFDNLVGQISQKLREASSLNELAEVAARELSQALGISNTVVAVGIDEHSDNFSQESHVTPSVNGQTINGQSMNHQD
ncbi:MAG: GAF domain-containing protein [Chloroflexota bacterium]